MRSSIKLALLALIIALGSCHDVEPEEAPLEAQSGEAGEDTRPARLRGGALALVGGNFNIWLENTEEGTTVMVGERLQFGEWSSFISLPAGKYRANAKRSSSTQVISIQIELQAGEAYTLLTAGEPGSGLTPESLFLIHDRHSRTTQVGHSQFKVVQASPDAGPIKTATMGEISTAEGLPYLGVSEYTKIGRGGVRLDITFEDPLLAVQRASWNAEGSTSYTVYVVGTSLWSLHAHQLRTIVVPTDTWILPATHFEEDASGGSMAQTTSLFTIVFAFIFAYLF